MPTTTTVRDRYGADDIRAYYDSGFWRDESLHALTGRQAAAYGDKVFLFDSTHSYTYAQLHELSLRLAVGLRRLGIARGDRVVVQLPNWVEFGLVAVALNRAGALLVPVMPIYRDEEVRHVLQHSGATAVVTCEDFKGFRYVDMFDGLRADCPDVAALVAARASAGLDRDVASSLDDLYAEGTAEELAEELGEDASPDDSFLVVYTSGTTARAKGCHHTLNTVRASAYAIAKSLDYDESDVQFGPSPVTHATGLVTSVLLPLVCGASSHLMEAWEPTEGIARVSQHGCTVTVTATAFLQMVMGAFDAGQHDISSMRLWVCAGSPIPGAVVENARTMLSGGRVLSLYGRSENFLTTMCTVEDPPERSVTSDGSALEGAQVKVVDPAGTEVPRGEEGDIAYRGPSHMLEYYRDPEQTQELFTPEGYSRSGDLGRMDSDGFVRVTGRLKDIVIRGGLNISAREIEDLLLGHEGVAAVAVVGFPDDRLGERVCAYIVPAPGHDPPTLEQFASYLRDKKVATPKIPERVEIVEALPMTATGKVQKHVLREDVAKKLLQ